MKKHISLFLTFILMACLSAGAQENQAELKSKVNEIKKSPDYIYAETTRETAEEAKSAAEEQLYNNINIWEEIVYMICILYFAISLQCFFCYIWERS